MQPGGAQEQGPAPSDPETIVLENSNHKLAFDPKSARLLSFRAQAVPEQEFAVSDDRVPVFVIQYLSRRKEFRQIASTTAREVSVAAEGRTLTAVFSQLRQLDLAAKVTVRIGNDGDPLSYWSISI